MAAIDPNEAPEKLPTSQSLKDAVALLRRLPNPTGAEQREAIEVPDRE